MYSFLLAIIYLAFISLGLPDSLVGAGWPVMHRDLGVPVSFAGIVTFIIAGGTIVASLASERLTRRFGAGRVTGISIALTAAALFGFSFASQFWMLLAWAIPYGLGAGAVDAALNNYVALHYAASHMNWLHSFWGVGASISPFVMSHALTSSLGWPGAYRVIGAIQVVVMLAVLASLPLWRGRRAVGPDAVEGAAPDGGHVPLGRAMAIPGVKLVLAAFLAYCALESTTMLWAASYLVAERGTAAPTAAALASLFLLGITAGRMLAGFFADRVGDVMLIRGGLLLVLLGAIVLALPFLPSWASLTGLAIAGLGAAPVYPAIIHSTPTNFGATNSQAIIGIQMAAAYTGSTLAPPAFGFLSEVTGMGLLPAFIGLLAIVALVMSEKLNQRRHLA